MAFLGMRGNGDWVTDQRPKNWRQQVLKLYPNGQAPLTAMLSMMKSASVDDPEFNWWTKTFSNVTGAVAGVYTLPDLSVAYVNGGVVGSIIYLSITTLLGNRVREGHQILLRDASDYTLDVVGKVVGVTRGAVNSVVAVKLLEADDNSTQGKTLADCDIFNIIGNINPEGGEMPEAIAMDPTKVYNYTQIFRTPLSITRTARKTKLRTGDQYQEAKAEALEMHSIEMELAFLWGIKTEKTGDNGKPERTTQGIINFIRQYAPANVDDFTLNATYHGKAWTDSGGGQTWLKNALEVLFRYGAEEKMAFVGSGALLGIDALAEEFGTIQLVPGAKAYGMQIREWITPFGSIYLKTHPLFSFDATTRNMMLLLEPKELTYRYIDDTQFKPYTDSAGHVDGTEEEFLTEAGLEFGLAQKCGLLNGVGLDH
jgi:hypothetical protein